MRFFHGYAILPETSGCCIDAYGRSHYCYAVKRLNLIGRRFDRLEVLGAAGTSSHGKSLWLVCCTCGSSPFVVIGSQLTFGKTRSCGCLQQESVIARNTDHGAAVRGDLLPEYRIWAHIIDRCTNPRNKMWSYYGGRGITVCDRWRNFKLFYADMGSRPSDTHSIDRKNNNGNYEPDNCRWATSYEQAQNQRTTRFLTFRGETLAMSEWARRLGLSIQTVASRLNKSKWSVEQALSTPVQKRRCR